MDVLTGDITGGQDPNYPGTNTAAQIDRSGIATSVTPSFVLAEYETGTSDNMADALELALGYGSDIFNCSWGVLGSLTPTTDYSGINAIIETAWTSGVLVVFAAGDNNTTPFSTTCNQNWPSNRTEVLATNGLFTIYGSHGLTNPTPSLSQLAWSTSGCPIDVYGPSGSYGAATSVMLGSSGPGVVSLNYYWDSFSNYGYADGSEPGSNAQGSSFSAPVISGAAALLADAFYENGYGVRPNSWLKSDLMRPTVDAALAWPRT